jgi:hypothetical protein
MIDCPEAADLRACPFQAFKLRTGAEACRYLMIPKFKSLPRFAKRRRRATE